MTRSGWRPRAAALLFTVGCEGIAFECRAATQTAHADAEDISAEVGQLSLEELMTVKISPFDVSTERDRGYQAFSSVTGARLDTPIKDLPFAIQAFTQPFIEDLKPVTIHDVAKYSPSVTYRSNDFNEGNANLAIRGFAVGTTPGGVQILRDGFHGPSIFEFTNVARLEIVKGPASFLYGQVAPGGVVNVITKSPRSQLGTFASIAYGSYGSYRFQGDVTGPIRKSLLFRIASSADQDIKYWRPYDAHSFDIAPTLLWRPSRGVSLTVKQEYYRKRETPQVMQKPGYGRQTGVVSTASDPNRAGTDVPGLPNDWNSMSVGDFRASDTNSWTATLDVEADEHWNLRAGYAHTQYEVDALFSGNFGMSNEFPFMQGRRLRRQTYANWDDTFEANATGKYHFGPASVRLLFGAQFVARRFDNSAGQAANDPAFGPVASPRPNWNLREPATWDRSALSASQIVPGISQRTRYQDQGVHAGATVGLFDDRLLVLAGVRGTKAESQLVDRLNARANPRFTAKKLTPQYALLYKVFPSVSLFATYAESFVPATDILQVRGVPTEAAKPTEGQGVDVGVKADLFGGRLAGTVTAFDIRNKHIINDFPELDPATGMQVFTRVQSGEQRCTGIEVDATLTPIDNWQAYVSYSYNDARIEEFTGRDAAILASGPATPGYKEVFLLHGAPLQMSAPHLANLWTRYDFAAGRLKGTYFAGGTNLVFDQTLLADTPSEFHQTYALFNALVGYSWAFYPHFQAGLELYGKNLSNRQYRPSQSSRSRPRELGVAFTVKY
jgi:iron complex outermembrane receptor protein